MATTAAALDAGVKTESGVWSWITTVDHKRVGFLYGTTALIFFLIGGVEALAIRIQLMRPDNHFVSPDFYNQLFTMHATTMIFMAVMPLSASFFNFMIPLMIGARDVAFPRLNAFSYWVFLLGCVFMNLSFVMGGAPDAGWFGYSDLTSKQFWLFGHPEVYILILPAMGIVSEVLPTFSRKPLFGYPVVVYSGIFIGFMGWGVWSHHMFSVGLGPLADSFFALSAMLIAIPTGVKIFNWLATLWGGKIELKTAMLFALVFIALFTLGGLSGFMHASPPADLQQTDTYFVVAHIHYVLFGGSIMGIFAGIYYWFPKMTGRMLGEGLGKWHFWLTMISMNLTFFP